MILRWLIQVCAVLAIAQSINVKDGVTDLLPGLVNLTEQTGQVCAYADFNKDRLTDIVQYRDGKLYVVLQLTKRFSESEDVAKSMMMDLGSTYSEVACSVGDINGDGNPDVVVSVRNGDDEEWEIKAFQMSRDQDKVEGKMVLLDEKLPKARNQIALMDVTGDGLHDVVGVRKNGDLLCLQGGQAALSMPCDDLFPSFSSPSDSSLHLHPLMPVLFGDLDGDLYAEIVFMKVKDGELRPEIWTRTGLAWERMEQQLPKADVKFTNVLASLLFDFNLDANMDFIVPICTDETCTSVDKLLMTHWEKEGFTKWETIRVDLGGGTLVPEPDTLVRMKAGDWNLDGFPDLLVTIGTLQGGNNYAAVLENTLVEEKTGRREYKMPMQKMVMPGLSLGQVRSSYFFDFAEDGYLDVIVQWQLSSGGQPQWKPLLSDEDKRGDVTFLKVQTMNPFSHDIRDGDGTVWGGVCVTYQMETAGIGQDRKAVECQIPANSHKAGLTPPFALFGLGRSPNFVDKMTVGVPRSPLGTSAKIMKHEHKQIVPNARIIVQPPKDSSSEFQLRLYVTPSSLIFSSLIVMASTCTILLVVVIILHYREKKMDRVERAAQSHQFHFDGM